MGSATEFSPQDVRVDEDLGHRLVNEGFGGS